MRARVCLCVAAAFVLGLTAPVLQAVGSQQLADLRVTVLLDQADKLSTALQSDDAHARVDEALTLSEKIGDRVGLAMAQRAKGLVFLRSSKATDAIVWYERALAGFEALGNRLGVADALAGLTSSAITIRDLAKARATAERALRIFGELGEDRRRAFILLNLSEIESAGPKQSALVDEVVAIAAKLGDDKLRAEGLRKIAGRQFGAGDFAGARRTYEEAIAALEKTPDVESIAATYLSLGRVFRAHGDYEGALQRYQKAIDLLAPTKERYTIVEATNAKAIALGYLNRRKESLAAYEQALVLARESGNRAMIDFIEGNLATGLLGAKEYDKAVRTLEAVIARKPEPRTLGYRYDALAQALTHAGRAAEAIESINESIRIARELKEVENLGFRLDDRVWILSKLGRYEEALADARESMSIVEQIRTRLVPSDFLKRGYAERVQGGYLRVVDILSRLGRGSEALEFAEQGRARAFLDLLAARETTSVDLTTRGGSLAAANASRDDVASEALGRPADLAGIRQIASRLKSTLVTYWVNDDATLIWVIGPRGEPRHVRVPIARDKVAALVAATTAPLRESAKATTTRGADAGQTGSPQATDDDLATIPMRGLGLLALSRDDKSAWRELYKTLIEPVRAHLPARGGRLTIIPHGPLLQMSFAALQTAAGRYLLEDYELHYAPAISALDFTGRRQQAVATNASGPWAIVGNPATLPTVGDRQLPPLPGAAREVASVSALSPKGGLLRIDGAGASEAALARALETSRPSILHFATHGFVFSDPKQAPFLALNRTGKTDADDGRLTLDEVYGLHLETNLVVLSACRTGSGHVSSDGVLGLTRGFFYAGSPSVLATFWDVVDEATANLMSGFYRGYAKAHAKGPSLRAAQLALLADLRAGKVVVTASGRRITLPEHPLLWAAFFLSGEP